MAIDFGDNNQTWVVKKNDLAKRLGGGFLLRTTATFEEVWAAVSAVVERFPIQKSFLERAGAEVTTLRKSPEKVIAYGPLTKDDKVALAHWALAVRPCDGGFHLFLVHGKAVSGQVKAATEMEGFLNLLVAQLQAAHSATEVAFAVGVSSLGRSDEASSEPGAVQVGLDEVEAISTTKSLLSANGAVITDEGPNELAGYVSSERNDSFQILFTPVGPSLTRVSGSGVGRGLRAVAWVTKELDERHPGAADPVVNDPYFAAERLASNGAVVTSVSDSVVAGYVPSGERREPFSLTLGSSSPNDEIQVSGEGRGLAAAEWAAAQIRSRRS